MELSCAFPTSHKIWRLCWRDCCHAELVWCACASSSYVPKIALPKGSQLRWRSALQSEAAVNFYTYEDEKVKSLKSKKMLLIVPQMNRVYNFVWVYPYYKQGTITCMIDIWFCKWNLFALQVHKSNNYNMKFALLQLPIMALKQDGMHFVLCPKQFKPVLYWRKIEGSPVLWNCKI